MQTDSLQLKNVGIRFTPPLQGGLRSAILGTRCLTASHIKLQGVDA